jgi:hypothetical protein
MRSVVMGLLGLLGGICVVGRVWAQAPAVPPVTPHFYALEQGSIVYEISGAARGKETLYFDQWGMRQARHKMIEAQRMGTSNTVTLNLGSEIVLMDPDKNLGQKKEDVKLKEVLSSFKGDDVDLIAVKLLVVLGGKKVSEEKVLDRLCEVWEIAALKMKTWLWNGIALKMRMDTAEGEVFYTAIKVDQNLLVDEELFSIPPEIHFVDFDINEILISKRMQNEF